METITSENAPPAIGPYSQAVVSGNIVYSSGCLAMDKAGNFLGGDAAAQARQALENLSHVLNAAGARLGLVLKVTVFLKNMSDFAAVNEVYATIFGNHRPARSCVAVSELPKGALVEIEAIAIRGSGNSL